ncbi:hypothetical protein [Paraburkholderia aspalathi]|uniref:Uncharacterized protein n=1 Tax=Paraburkholderia aspalathi TaxID=1324617 RepID=A0A1I7EAI0_9BURK|nr:hypothetical protein [Paraburkholderia aspalathi]SFU20950.1 hypothetical protein SAMN05192563_1015151 [Paraburkholderia aspalathi]
MSAIEAEVLVWILEQREPALIDAVRANDQSGELLEGLRFLRRLRAQACSHHVGVHLDAEEEISCSLDDCECGRPTREDFEHVLHRERHQPLQEPARRTVRALRLATAYGERSAPPGHPFAWTGPATGRRIEVCEPLPFITPVSKLFAHRPHTGFIATVDAPPPGLCNATTSRHMLVVDASRHDVSPFGRRFDRRHWHCETRAFRNTPLHTTLVPFFALECGAVLLPLDDLFAHASRFGTELPVLYVRPKGPCLVVYPIPVAALQRKLASVTPSRVERTLDEFGGLDRLQATSAGRMQREAGKAMPIAIF